MRLVLQTIKSGAFSLTNFKETYGVIEGLWQKYAKNNKKQKNRIEKNQNRTYCLIAKNTAGSKENNHTNLRKILSKGKSFNNLTQADVDKIISHLNSYNRKSFNNKTALEMFAVIYGEEVIQKLNIEEIHPNLVIMTPDLIGWY